MTNSIKITKSIKYEQFYQNDQKWPISKIDQNDPISKNDQNDPISKNDQFYQNDQK